MLLALCARTRPWHSMQRIGAPGGDFNALGSQPVATGPLDSHFTDVVCHAPQYGTARPGFQTSRSGGLISTDPLPSAPHPFLPPRRPPRADRRRLVGHRLRLCRGAGRGGGGGAPRGALGDEARGSRRGAAGGGTPRPRPAARRGRRGADAEGGRGGGSVRHPRQQRRLRPPGPAARDRARGLRRRADLNLRGAYFLAQAVARGLSRRAGSGSLITISTQMGHVGAIDRAVYCATKHAVEGFTKAMAIEWLGAASASTPSLPHLHPHAPDRGDTRRPRAPRLAGGEDKARPRRPRRGHPRAGALPRLRCQRARHRRRADGRRRMDRGLTADEGAPPDGRGGHGPASRRSATHSPRRLSLPTQGRSTASMVDGASLCLTSPPGSGGSPARRVKAARRTSGSSTPPSRPRFEDQIERRSRCPAHAGEARLAADLRSRASRLGAEHVRPWEDCAREEPGVAQGIRPTRSGCPRPCPRIGLTSISVPSRPMRARAPPRPDGRGRAGSRADEVEARPAAPWRRPHRTDVAEAASRACAPLSSSRARRSRGTGDPELGDQQRSVPLRSRCWSCARCSSFATMPSSASHPRPGRRPSRCGRRSATTRRLFAPSMNAAAGADRLGDLRRRPKVRRTPRSTA